jgi:hypothetical protein
MLFQSLPSTAERVFVDFVLGARSQLTTSERKEHTIRLTLI